MIRIIRFLTEVKVRLVFGILISIKNQIIADFRTFELIVFLIMVPEN